MASIKKIKQVAREWSLDGHKVNFCSEDKLLYVNVVSEAHKDGQCLAMTKAQVIGLSALLDDVLEDLSADEASEKPKKEPIYRRRSDPDDGYTG